MGKNCCIRLAFKSNTNDIENPAIQICKNLIDEGAALFIRSKLIMNRSQGFKFKTIIFRDLDEKANPENFCGYWDTVNSLENAFTEADAVLVLTEWAEYKKIDWVNVSLQMRKPSWLFDSRSVIDPAELENTDIKFWRIGDGLQK